MILVSSVIILGKGVGQAISSSNLSIMTSFFTLTAPISIIWSIPLFKPVVSVSYTTYSWSNKGYSLFLNTILDSTSTTLSSAPYKALNLSASSFPLFIFCKALNISG